MGLTEKELQILKLRKQGLNQIQIAKSLKISQSAVSSFENNAHKKINDYQSSLALIKKLGIKIK